MKMGLKQKLGERELDIMQVLWQSGSATVADVHQSLQNKRDDIAYTTVQTMIYRLEEKGAVRRVKKVGNAHIFEALLTRKAVRKRLVGDLLEMFGGSPASVMSHLVETGKLTLADIRAIETELAKKEK